jgi:hypothetical protein
MKVFCILIAEEEITPESFVLMDEETLKAVVPRAGPRAVMLAKTKTVCM